MSMCMIQFSNKSLLEQSSRTNEVQKLRFSYTDIWNYAYHFIICLLSLHFAFHSSVSFFLPTSRSTEHFSVEECWGFIVAILSTLLQSSHTVSNTVALCSKCWLEQQVVFVFCIFLRVCNTLNFHHLCLPALQPGSRSWLSSSPSGRLFFPSAGFWSRGSGWQPFTIV